MSERVEKLPPADWAKCIDPKGCYAPLISVIENSDWLGKSSEPITFMEGIERAKDLAKWLEPRQ
jgi:hypothetical protein